MGILEAQDNIWKLINGTGILGVGPDGSIFAYGEYGSLSRSQDEGQTWQIVLGQETGFTGHINSSCFAVSHEGRICVFNDNQQTVVYSDDNGDTWQQTPTISQCGMPTKAGICAPTNDIFVVWAEDGEIEYSLDGGETWDGWVLGSLENSESVSDLLVNENGDVYVSVAYYIMNIVGIYHSTLSDIQNWELVAAEGIGVEDMELDPEGDVVACGWIDEGSIGFQHTPGFYLFDGTSLAIGDGGIVYTPHFMGLQAVLTYSTDHGEHFTEIGEHLPLVDIAPGGDGARLFKGADNHLYFDGGGEYWKSIPNADEIPTYNPLIGTQFLDEASSLYYSIISTNPPHVSVAGHVDGTNAQGELIIPETVNYEDVTYTVTKIGYEAFYNCSGLTGNLVIPSTVDTIMTRAFKSCSGFTGNLVIPNSVRHLGGGAFNWCYGFDGTLVLPEAIPAIYSYTFEGCTGLTGTLNIPSTVTSIGPAAFGYCPGFTGTLVIPESVVELSTPVPPVNGIRGAFEECSGFTGLVLPESLRIIGGGNGGGCFAYCTGLTGELVIPNKVKVIGHSAFYDCTGLTGELHLPDSLQSIGYEAFALCSGLTGRLVFPDALETIDNEAFVRCSGFSEVDLNHQVFYQNNFGNAVFAYWSMESLELPEGWTTTGQRTFKGCDNLRTVHLPESLTKIDGDCFQDCSNLTEINIPENVTIIGSGAFDGCSSLTSLELPANLSQLGGFALRNCTSLTGELVVPDRVEMIEQLVFAGCTNLNRIVLGSSVNTINDNAFKNMVLDTLVIKAMTPPVLRHFPNQGLPFEQLVIVPCGTLEAYQNAEGWSNFTNIVEDCGSGLVGFSGAEWYYEIQNENGSITYQHLEYAADTTVNHKDVQIIIRTNTLYDKSEHVEVTREYIYEEDNVVYWWNKDLQEFTTLYNLDAEVGDTWEIKVGMESLTMHVDGVEQYYYDGSLFKMLRVSDDEDLFSGIIVFGIGHLTSFFPERLMTRGKGYRVEGMRCYWRNGELFFKYGEEDCDEVYEEWHNGIEEDGPSTGSGTLSIYPNPTHNVLFVETRLIASLPTQYRITNLMGQTLMSGQITAETQQIDVSILPNGMFFVVIDNMAQKFIKQ